jgi:beta-N-acetylhexosaminidase
VIGDRAFADDPAVVARLGRAACEGLRAGGVAPVIKHLPGHGRAGVDSHLALPVVEAPRAELERTDFPPFRDLADMPWAMTAHVVYTALDPDRPATTSRTVIEGVIRGAFGFDGVLLSDDLCMRALDGTPAERVRAALAAGCDVVLHCNGDLAEMQSVAAACPPPSPATAARLARAAAWRRPSEPFDRTAARRRRDALLEAAVA